MLLDSPMFKHACTTAARGAAGTGSAAVTALDLDDPNEVTGADSAEVSKDDEDGDDTGVDPFARTYERRRRTKAASS